jgi:uncharacterized protein YutE (UPF0331/DUF86 family)
MVDPLRLRSVLQRAESEMLRLRQLALHPGLDDDELVLAAAKYHLVVLTESCIDAVRHVLASNRLRPAETYADAFVALAEAEVVPADLARRMADMARFRNLLVHGYAIVDDRRVVEVVRGGLPDVEDLIQRLSQLA